MRRMRVGPQDSSGRREEYRRAPEFEPGTVQLVANRYTDWAIPAHLNAYVSVQYFRVYLNVISYVSVFVLWYFLQNFSFRSSVDVTYALYAFRCVILLIPIGHHQPSSRLQMV
jgi:hypothetical protein